MTDTLPEQAPMCGACVGEGTDPATGRACVRCKGTGTDPDPLARPGSRWRHERRRAGRDRPRLP